MNRGREIVAVCRNVHAHPLSRGECCPPRRFSVFDHVTERETDRAPQEMAQRSECIGHHGRIQLVAAAAMSLVFVYKRAGTRATC